MSVTFAFYQKYFFYDKMDLRIFYFCLTVYIHREREHVWERNINRQRHSPAVNHFVFSVYDLKVTGSLIMRLGPWAYAMGLVWLELETFRFVVNVFTLNVTLYISRYSIYSSQCPIFLPISLNKGNFLWKETRTNT